MKKTEQSPQGSPAASRLPQRRPQAAAPAGGPLSSLAAALNQSPVVQAQSKLAQEINQGWSRNMEYGLGPTVAAVGNAPIEASLDLQSTASETASAANAPVQRHAIVQRVKYGEALGAAFGEGPPEGEQAAEAYGTGGKFFGKGFAINATFNPDRVRIGEEGSKEETYHTVEYRQYIRGEFRAKGQVVPTKLYKETTLDKTTYKEDGKGNLRYGHRNEGDNHGKYKDNGDGEDGGSSYTGKDIPSINVDKGETVSINLDFQGKLMKTDAKSNIVGPALAQREWSIKGTYTRPKSAGAVVPPKAEGKKGGKPPGPPPGSGKKAAPPGGSRRRGKNRSMALEREVADGYESADFESDFAGAVSTLPFAEHPAAGVAQPALARVAQLTKAGAILGIAGHEMREKALVAGYLAHTIHKDLNSAMAPNDILKTELGEDYLTGDKWQDVDIPEWLATRIAILPSYYVPTTAKIWKEFIDRIKTRSGRLTVPDEVDRSVHTRDEGIEEQRRIILEGVAKNTDEVTKKLSADGQKLYDKILNAEITVNFSLDKLFNYRSPQLLNAFEVQDKFKIQSNNIEGNLAEERRQAEKNKFGIPQHSMVSRLRPRYAALNFKGHSGGATPRNDYGLSYMVLSKGLASSCTITIGDSFDAAKAYPYTPAGVKSLAADVDAERLMHSNILSEAAYDPGDTYVEVQIHQDLDLRKDVERIMVSKVEMRVFRLDVRTVKGMIDALAGEGVFIQQ